MSVTSPIIKNVIHTGQKYIPLENGSKVHFHFQTWKLGKERVLIDDSRKIGKKEPMILVLGHKFKLEVWETIVKMMAVGEVASFVVKKELVYSYPFVSKTLRELGQDAHKVKHTCTMTLHTEGIGYDDLNDLINSPCDLEFILELLQVERSNEYEKEMWQLNIQERLDLVPELKKKGNNLYKQMLYKEAEDAYSQALGICEQLMIRERKGDEEWNSINVIKLPILLNYAQCKLLSGDFYSVIEHCNTVLEYEPNNEKALFRRAKAHAGAWNPDKAEEDFIHLKSLNPSMAAVIDKELDNIKKQRKEKEEQEKNALKKLFISNGGNSLETHSNNKI